MPPTPLEKRPLAATGLNVTTLGLGGAALGWGITTDEAIATVLHALDRGINLIDTSPHYDDSEARIGLALRQYFAAGGRRDGLVISTKTGTGVTPRDYSARWTRVSIARSLERLGLDQLDLVHLHDPQGPGELEAALAPGGALDALEELKARGTIRAIGIGVYAHPLIQRCIATQRFDVVLTYRDYNLVHQSAAAGVLAPAAAAGVAVVNGSATLWGLLGAADPASHAIDHPWIRPDERARALTLWNWARQHDLDLLTLNLQFCQREKRIASTLVGATSPAQVDADVAALAHPIPPTVWPQLHRAFAIEI